MTIEINQKVILTAAAILLVVSLSFFAGKFTAAEKSDTRGQEEINQNSVPNIPSGGGGCGV